MAGPLFSHGQRIRRGYFNVYIGPSVHRVSVCHITRNTAAIAAAYAILPANVRLVYRIHVIPKETKP